MKKWRAVIILGCAQFVMVLDSTVMNVSISQVVVDLDTTVSALQAAITFYTLTMAAGMLLGAKLGDVWGRRRALAIGAAIYAVGSLLTALSPNIAVLFLGWSVIEGIGAVLVIPAIASLIAGNYTGQDRVVAFAIIGGSSGVAVAAGPLIGGFFTTYLSWRYVFVGEVIIMLGLLLMVRLIPDTSTPQRLRIDFPSVVLSALSLILIVLGLLQSKTWGWIRPLNSPEIGGVPIEPLGISLTAYCILAGAALMLAFVSRQRRLVSTGRAPLVDVTMLRITQLRSGLTVLWAQYTVTAGLFFMIPVYLQMTLGYNALETGLKIFPLSVALILFSFAGSQLGSRWSPRRIVRVGLGLLVVGLVVLLSSVSLDLRSVFFGVGMFAAGAALGLLASQIGNVTMSSVAERQTSEVGGLQGVAQNLGSSLGTALIGSVLIAALTTSFPAAVNGSDVSPAAKTAVQEGTAEGVDIVAASSVPDIAEEFGLSDEDGEALTQLYSESQVSSLRASLFVLTLFAVGSLAFTAGIPSTLQVRKRESAKPVP
ncbi:putative MFS family arabinose efflux permease [Glaciihabitans tibetensis]|uniref:Putative MFS family arabinose efflux permease n=1 Tax=Glaciihabitans tibetensis TaxID=1266600 RepID=A0A2T0VIK2_9MICO|nr:MFS transporter [Glaciihabitans tibetensis]PRY70013.1 putative MFS family arabinose efflux permease [Glaciihabitans tibetensis]